MNTAQVTLRPLLDTRVLTLAINLPGPLAAARLRQLGADVIKIEPPSGDPLADALPTWYQTLHEGIDIVRLNLKDGSERTRLASWLGETDLLLTANRPAILERFGLSWNELHPRYAKLCQVALVGYPPPLQNLPGHDLTYQASFGLLEPPHLPRALVADFAGAQAAVSAALALILARERGQGAQYAEVSLADAAKQLAEPLRFGLTASAGVLGGGLPGYNLYRSKDGWIALAALEPHFWQRLSGALNLESPTREQLQETFLTQTAGEWESWAREQDLPLAALK